MKTITPEKGKELEEATLQNIVGKIEEGGIPTAREIDMLRDATAKPVEVVRSVEPESETVQDKELAELSDLSIRHIHRFADEGVIPRSVTKGNYLFRASVRGIIRYYRDQSSGITEGKAKDVARKAKADANSAELDEAEKRGLLMFREDAARIFAEARVEIRQLIEKAAIPEKVKVKLCADIAKLKLVEKE